MGVQCQILIKKPKEGIHRAGKAVSGMVKYFVDEPTEYQNVTLSFIGKGECAWTRKSGKTSHTYRGTEDYVTHHINVCNKKPEDTITLGGKYEYPFEFYLPEDIPRSYKHEIGSIKYWVQLKFEKPSFFSFNKVFKAEIPVYSYIQPTGPEGPVIFGLEKTLFSLFADKEPVINLKAEINKTVFTPGENAHLNYVVTNATDVDITSVKTELYCYTKFTSDCEATNLRTEKVDNCEIESESFSKGVHQFSTTLPTAPNLYSIQQSKVVSMEYRVVTTLRLPIPHINATVEIPVLIGEVKGSEESNLEEDADPPSYWEAMDESDKEDEDKEKE